MGFWDKVKKTLVGAPPPADPEPKRANDDPGTGEVHARSGDVGDYRAVRIEHGIKGWGGPLIIQPTTERNLIYSVTGGGIHPLAQKIADITGGKPFDGFKSKADFGQIAVAVIDCGGTARVGVYPMKGIPTVDIYSASPSGPLMKYINEKNFVSGVKLENLHPV